MAILTCEAQVTKLWESPSTYGRKGFLYQFNSTNTEYFYVCDTTTHDCKIYYTDNFILKFTLTSVNVNDILYCLLPDMNSNGQPEILIYNGMGGVKIRDLQTGENIYNWPSALFGGVWVSGNMLNMIFIQYDSLMHSSYVFYSLGVTVPTSVGGNDDLNNLPDKMSLYQNYPNPFNPSTAIEYSLPHEENVLVCVYDISGRLIKTLVTGLQTPGVHNVIWDGTNNIGASVSSGTYFYEVKTSTSLLTQKMIFLK